MPSPKTWNRSAVRRITQVIDSNSRMRVPMASARPKKRALGCCSTGKRLTRMEMKMMLSMPRTISRAVRVRNATQISGLLSHSIQRYSRERGRLGKKVPGSHTTDTRRSAGSSRTDHGFGNVSLLTPAAHRLLEKQPIGHLQQRAGSVLSEILQGGIEQIDGNYPSLDPRLVGAVDDLHGIADAKRPHGEDQ